MYSTLSKYKYTYLDSSGTSNARETENSSSDESSEDGSADGHANHADEREKPEYFADEHEAIEHAAFQAFNYELGDDEQNSFVAETAQWNLMALFARERSGARGAKYEGKKRKWKVRRPDKGGRTKHAHFGTSLTLEDRRKKLQKLKEKTKCNACGAKGHWANDPNCPKKGQGPYSTKFRKTKKGHVATAMMQTSVTVSALNMAFCTCRPCGYCLNKADQRARDDEKLEERLAGDQLQQAEGYSGAEYKAKEQLLKENDPETSSSAISRCPKR